MTLSNKITPAHILRMYTWELLKANTNLALVNGLVPVIPIEDEPRFADSGKTYIIYGYSDNYDGQMREIRRGHFSLRVNAQTFAELGEVTTTISRAFETGDIAAANVNAWSSNYSAGALLGIKFTSLDVTFVDGGNAAKTEGGPVEGIVNISYRYITQQTVKQYDTNTNTWV